MQVNFDDYISSVQSGITSRPSSTDTFIFGNMMTQMQQAGLGQIGCSPVISEAVANTGLDYDSGRALLAQQAALTTATMSSIETPYNTNNSTTGSITDALPNTDPEIANYFNALSFLANAG